MSARRPWASPLVPLYSAGIRVKECLRNAGLLKSRRLARPVLSIGSVSAGGAGKTPVVIALAKILSQRGWAVDVLSRGYGRTGTEPLQVMSDAPNAAAVFGDEPLLIANRTGRPVWVYADRYIAGCYAEQKHIEAPGVHLLDDGFQHRRLARDLDILVLTAEDLHDTLLPAGNLREGLEAIRRADAVVIREDELEAVKSRAWERMKEGAQMWIVRRTLVFPAPMYVFTAGLRPVAFCGIARPEGFQSMLIEAGCGVVETIAYADHHVYTMQDVEHILAVARKLNATGFVTTEKDQVKLTREMIDRLATFGAVMTVTLEAEFRDPDAVAAAIESKLECTPGGNRA